MPVHYRFDSNIIILEMDGYYELEEIHQTLLNSLEDSQCPANPSVLVDLTKSRSIFERSPGQVQSMALTLAPLSKRFNDRIALVAPSDLAFGLMRMGSAFSEEKGYSPQVFRTFEEARDWLL